MHKWEFVGGVSVFFWFIFCVHFFLALKMFCSSYNIMTDWALLDPEEEPLLVFLGFSRFLSSLFFFCPHLLHWLSGFSGLSAVGYFVRTNTANGVNDFFFFLMTHALHCRMEIEWNSVCPLLTCQMHPILECIISFS